MTTPPDSPPSEPTELSEVWAKSADKGADGKPETLTEHTWRVLAQLAMRVQLRPNLPEQLGVPRLWHILFWAAFLHDFGKAAQGFQNGLWGGEKWQHRHEVLSLAFVDWVLAGFNTDEQRWLVSAIASHHRDLSEIKARYNEAGDRDGHEMQRLVDEISPDVMRGLWQWLHDHALNWANALGLAHVVQPIHLPEHAEAVRQVQQTGGKRIRKWLRLWDKFFEELAITEDAAPTSTIALRGHLITADHTASAHVGDLPKPQLDDPQELMRKLRLDMPYDHQTEALNTHDNVVLMAPTGSGKTEAALLWAVAQANTPRLFYVLPFQASMNAMERRLTEDEVDGEGKVTREAPFKRQVGLEHSRSTLALYKKYLDEDPSKENAVKMARQAMNLARLHYFPVRILTPYQLLKAPYRLSGYESLLSDCFNGVFVFDEIHAFEPERLAQILAMVKHLRQHYGARFLMMSATLPGLLRERLSDALGSVKMITAAPKLYEDFRRHALHLREGDLLDAAHMQHIAEAARGGTSVLVCCNTVKRALEARRVLMELLGGDAKVEMLHGRFNGKDRLVKESVVREATGSRSQNRKPIMLVATQVVEVSLDIDLDEIYTDPAPLEALLQRFGRINRRQKIKPSAPVYVFKQPDDGHRIYNPLLVQASLRVLAEHDGAMIDEANVSAWLDEVYDDEAIRQDWTTRYEQAYASFERGVLQSLRAFQSDKNLAQNFYAAFDGVPVLPVGLQHEYDDKKEQNPLEASELLVNLRWGQFAMLKQKGLVREETESKKWYPPVVMCHYDEDAGLDVYRPVRLSAVTDDVEDSI
jgi:CRISPR-associated endonuclease/helicase Cas3